MLNDYRINRPHKGAGWDFGGWDFVGWDFVSHESTKQMELALQDYPSPIEEGLLPFSPNFIYIFCFLYIIIYFSFAYVAVDQDLGPGLREICAANRSDEKQVIFNLLISF